MNSTNKILQDAILLLEDQRLAIPNQLLMQREPHASEGVEAAWDTAIIEDKICSQN